MAFTLKLGSLDLSPYPRLAPGEGFDPYATDWREPQFVDSPFGDGQILTAIDVKNRPMAIPLFLHGSTNTKDQLHQLVRDINAELAKPKPLRVEWKDSGASDSTFYDVVFGRFDPDFNYRRSEKGWAAGILRLWTSGYGHTATERICATAAGSGVTLGVAIPSIAGDGPALLDVRVGVGSAAIDGRIVGVSVLRHASYAHFIPAASLLNLAPSTVLRGGSGAPGSQYLGFFGQGSNLASGMTPAFSAALAPASVYEGGNRIFAVARTGFRPGMQMRGAVEGNPFGPTAMATQLPLAGWQLVDLGRLGVQPAPGQGTVVLDVTAGAVGSGGNWYGRDLAIEPVSGATEYLQVAGITVLPEDQTSLALDSRSQLLGWDGFDRSASGVLTGQVDQLGNTWELADPLVAPRQLWIDGVGVDGDAGPFHPSQAGVLTVFGNRLSPKVQDCHIEAYFNNPVIQPSQQFLIGKVANANSYVTVSLTASQMEGGVRDGTVFSSLGAVGIPTSAFTGGELILDIKGQMVTFSMLNPAGSVVASRVTDAGMAGRLVGHPLLELGATGGAAAVFNGFRVSEYPSQALTPRQQYRFDGVNDRAWKDTASGGVYVRSLDEQRRGRIPQAAPSTPRIVALSMPMHRFASPGNDILDVDVRVRERFSFAR